MIDYLLKNKNMVFQHFYEHFEMTLISIVIALLFSLSIVVLIIYFKRLQNIAIYLFSLIYAIPSYSLFALLIPFSGLGKTSAIIVLIMYAQYILLRNFLVGINQVQAEIIDISYGLGMTKFQVLYKIILPLSKGAIFSGIKVATNSIIAILSIAATINAGGLGVIIFDGLRSMSLMKILLGIILILLLSFLFNLVFYLIEELLKNNHNEV